MRSSIVALAALVLIPAGLWAEEIRGQIKTVDTSANTITLTVDGKARTFQCAQNCRIINPTRVSTGLLGRRTVIQDTLTTLGQLTEGTQVTLTTETRNNAEVATQIRGQNVQMSNTGRRRLVR